ncbi:VCBS repeat-containing protein [Oerskovia sp. M15]
MATGVPASSSTVEAIAPGDWNGDGKADIILRRSNGDLVLHAGQGGGRFAGSGQRIGNGWAAMTQVIGAGDWLGTGKPGLIALHRPSGRIWLYPGTAVEASVLV